MTATTHRIQSGETLSQLARRFGTSVAELAKANGISDPDKIYAGHTLNIPGKNDGFDQKKTQKQRPPQQSPDTLETPVKQQTQQPQTQTQTQTEQTQQTSQVQSQTNSTTGEYPLYSQTDPKWHTNPMGTDGRSHDTIGWQGCAMTSATMALDGITGQKLTPGQMNDFLRKNGGYDKSGNVNWDKLGKAYNPPVGTKRQPEGSFGPKQIDAELAAGRPVMVHVDYHGKAKGSGPDGKGDHWILVTGKDAKGHYIANDPAGGKKITLHSDGNKLVNDSGKPYQTTGGAVTFSRGPAKTNNTSQTTQTQQTTQTETNQTSSKRGNDLSGNWKAAKGHSASEYDALINESAKKYGVEPRFVKAVIEQESHFNPNVSSKKDASGLMQLLPGAWSDMGGGNRNDPKTNIDHGTKYLAQLLKRYGGDQQKALAAYNWGMGNVDKHLKAHNGQLVLSQAPAETRGYVTNIMQAYRGEAYH
ncbi:MAG: transglycosylase SLT domain-containing protein [Myxococcaceae bacterium]